jgi:hypothetical protein
MPPGGTYAQNLTEMAYPDTAPKQKLRNKMAEYK